MENWIYQVSFRKIQPNICTVCTILLTFQWIWIFSNTVHVLLNIQNLYRIRILSNMWLNGHSDPQLFISECHIFWQLLTENIYIYIKKILCCALLLLATSSGIESLTYLKILLIRILYLNQLFFDREYILTKL